MEQRSSVALENVASSEETSPESPSASVGTSPAEILPRTPAAVLAGPGSSAIEVSPSTDSGYAEANSSTISADSSTQAHGGGGSLESSPSGGDAVVTIKEGYVIAIANHCMKMIFLAIMIAF